MTTRILPSLLGRGRSESNCPKKRATNEQQDLQFVNLPNNLKLDIAARRRVRSHVARDFHRRAKVPGSSNPDVDLDIAKRAAREAALGQKHRFRFGQQGPYETGKQSARRSTPRKSSSVSQTKLLPRSSVSRSDKTREDPGGINELEGPGLQNEVGAEEFVAGLPVDASYRSNSMRDESYPISTQSNTSSQCCATAQQSMDRLGSNRMVCRAQTGHKYPPVQKLHLSTAGTGSLDPFNSTPIIDSSCRTQILMHHFHLRIMASPLMMNPRKEWFSLAIQDHALFHVALSHAAGNLGLLMQRGDSVESLLHRMEAIRIINDRLSDLSCGVSDGTIGAVASMASYEATNGSLDGIRTHMAGLEQMVVMRGGLQQGGFSAHLRRLIAWADLNSANALSTAPRFPPLSDRLHLQSDQFEIDPIAFQLYSTPISTSSTRPATSQSSPTTISDSSSTPSSFIMSAKFDFQVLAPKVTYCFITLRQLSRLLNISGPKAIVRMDHTWYSDMAYTLQRRLMHLCDTFSSQPSRIERPCCVAALIFLECCIREIHCRSRIVETLVKDLRTTLLQVKGLASAGMSNLILWALTVGVAASRERAEHEWFVAQLGALCGFLGVRGWSRAKGILQGILWPEKESELTRALVWTEVEMADDRIDCWTMGSD